MCCVGRKWHAALVIVGVVAGESRASFAMNDLDGSLAGDAGASDAAAVGDACARAACPVAEPALGDPCDPSTAACEYGEDPRHQCNRVYSCVSGHFQITTFPAQSPSDLPDAAGCPTTLPADCPPSLASVAVGAACTPNLRCPYVDGECACFAGDDAGAWACAPGNVLGGSDAACPAVRPHLGASCPAQSGYCVYDFDCSFEACSCGEWVWGYSECPPKLNVPPPVDVSVDAGAEGGADGGAGSPLDGSVGRGDSGLVAASPTAGASGRAERAEAAAAASPVGSLAMSQAWACFSASPS
jgi:hypothetical protein